MRIAIEADIDYWIDGEADILLQIVAAAQPDQRIIDGDLRVHSPRPLRAVPGEDAIGQRTWALGSGRFEAYYRAEVVIERPEVDLATLAATPVRALPAETIGYLLPSRYVEADRFEDFIKAEFAGLAGGALALALAEWVRTTVRYLPSVTSGTTSALLTFAERRGVCRDYAHLLAALARAAGIPARCVSAYAPGVDPPDFHAVCELWLEGGWHLVDPTGMAVAGELARVVVGRDATDIAFMTIFGRAMLNRQRVSVMRLA
jgi:transglutaminase-like putative cysteine protease